MRTPWAEAACCNVLQPAQAARCATLQPAQRGAVCLPGSKARPACLAKNPATSHPACPRKHPSPPPAYLAQNTDFVSSAPGT
eukprot:355829-Chlamydomonas_euryale.AAC.3